MSSLAGIGKCPRCGGRIRGENSYCNTCGETLPRGSDVIDDLKNIGVMRWFSGLGKRRAATILVSIPLVLPAPLIGAAIAMQAIKGSSTSEKQDWFILCLIAVVNVVLSIWLLSWFADFIISAVLGWWNIAPLIDNVPAQAGSAIRA